MRGVGENIFPFCPDARLFGVLSANSTRSRVYFFFVERVFAPIEIFSETGEGKNTSVGSKIRRGGL